MSSQARMGQSAPSFDAKRIFPDPNYADKIVVEVVSRKLENYAEVPYGTAHPNTALFPDHRLALQVEQSEEDVIRYYASDRIGQQVYNGNISYSGESNAHPIFTRDHIIRRSDYAVIAKLTPLSGLVDADVTAAGTGYEQATTTASLAGGTGSGGSVGVLVSNGAVVGLHVITPGNYTVAPTVTITSTGSGAGASGTVSIQPAGAVLAKEDMQAKAGDERIDGLYGLVRYIWETLPGPWIPRTRYENNIGPIQSRYRAVANTGQASTLVLNGGATGTIQTTYHGREGSSIVLLEIEDTFLFANAVPQTSEPYDPESNTFLGVTRTLKKSSSFSPSAGIVNIAGTDYIQVVTKEPYDAFSSWEVVTLYTLPAAQSEGTQMTVSQRSQPIQFPATLDAVWYLATDGLIGYNKAFIRRVKVTRKVYWVFSATKPALNLDIPVLVSVWSVLSGENNLGEVIMDDVTIFYEGADVAYPDSTPDLTTYLSAWVGATGERPALGDVEQDGNIFRWKVWRDFYQFLVQEQPVIT